MNTIYTVSCQHHHTPNSKYKLSWRGTQSLQTGPLFTALLLAWGVGGGGGVKVSGSPPSLIHRPRRLLVEPRADPWGLVEAA